MTRLEARELTCAYNQHTVLHDLALIVQPGEILASLGPNGAGKTTLLRALARLLRPHTGTVLLDGTCRTRPMTIRPASKCWRRPISRYCATVSSPNSQAANNGASFWRGPWRNNRRSCCWMSPRHTWIYGIRRNC